LTALKSDPEADYASFHATVATVATVASKAIDDASNSVLEVALAEVYSDPEALPGQAEIRKQLQVMHWSELTNAFHFHNDGFLDYQVRAKSIGIPDSIVHDRDALLPLDLQAVVPELTRQNRTVNGFQHSRPEISVYPIRVVQHNRRYPIQAIRIHAEHYKTIGGVRIAISDASNRCDRCDRCVK
jgi:hypothetical protein